MASIREKEGKAFQVRWRDPETGKDRSREFSYGTGNGNTARDEIKREDALNTAEAFRGSVTQSERRSARSLERLIARHGLPEGYRPIFTEPFGEEALTVTNFAREMIKSNRTLSDGAVTKYTSTINAHIEGTDLGRTDVRFVDEDKVEQYWNALNLGDGALRGVKQILAMTFNRALKRGVIDRSPLERLDLSVKVRDPADIEPLTADQVEALAEAALRTRDRLAILLMGYCGLRVGEVSALRVQDVDVARCRINVRQQIALGKVSALKSRAARRTLGVGCSITNEIQRYIEDGNASSDGYLFKSQRGAFLLSKAVNAALRNAAKRAGIHRHVHAHLLRHTAISLLIVEKHLNPKAIQQFAGHANITITLNTYSHLFDYGAETVAEAMEEIRQSARNGGSR